MKRAEKGEGFPGQRIVVLPRSVMGRAKEHGLIDSLLPTDVGYFPHAQGHLRERPTGADQAIFIYCTKGFGWCELASRHHTVKAGELLVVPPNVPHVYGADKRRPWSIHWFHVAGDKLNLFLNELGVSVDRPVIGLGEDTQLLSLFEELLDILEHGYTTLQLVYASQALAHLMAVMIRDHRNGHTEQPTSKQKITRTVEYMKQHVHQSLKLDALAGVANLSRSRYTALFKEQMGFAPMDYFARLRMHFACQLLDTTDLSVKAVAGRLGFDDPLYFSKVFRAMNEKTPTQYRKMRKG